MEEETTLQDKELMLELLLYTLLEMDLNLTEIHIIPTLTLKLIRSTETLVIEQSTLVRLSEEMVRGELPA